MQHVRSKPSILLSFVFLTMGTADTFQLWEYKYLSSCFLLENFNTSILNLDFIVTSHTSLQIYRRIHLKAQTVCCLFHISTYLCNWLCNCGANTPRGRLYFLWTTCLTRMHFTRNTPPRGDPKSLQEEAATSHHADKFCCLDLPNMENSQASLQKARTSHPDCLLPAG